MFSRLNTTGKFAVIFLIVALLVGGLWLANDKGLLSKVVPKGRTGSSSKLFSKKSDVTIKCAVNTWGGFAPYVYFNEGFKASPESRYTKEYGINVEFVLIDDFNASRDAWKSGSVDIICNTADVLPTEIPNLMTFKPKVFVQIDWSDGGDVIVVRRGINNVADLKGKKVAIALGTPSQTLLFKVLETAGLQYDDIKPAQMQNALDAATAFKAGQVDAAVMWSPDDQDCIAQVKGSKVLLSSRDASKTIADIFYCKEDFLNAHEKELKAFVEGALKAAAEINTNPAAKQKAIQLMATNFNQPVDFMTTAVGNARLCTYGDNVNFFNLNGTYNGVKGEDLYGQMAVLYNKVGLAPEVVPNWRSIVNTTILRSISLTGIGNEAEVEKTFTAPTKAEETVEPVSTKRVTINFATGIYALDDNCKYIIDNEFVSIAKAYPRLRIRIEGNTDNVGMKDLNITLSKKRAQSVAEYLSSLGFDANRFVVVGNGPDNPIASNETKEGKAKNRRTDFELLKD